MVLDRQGHDPLPLHDPSGVRSAHAPLPPLLQRAFALLDTLEQALPYIKNIRRWRVGPSNAVRNAEDYAAELRFYLDTDKLPKPMQVVNTGSSDWTLTSDWIELPIPAEVIAPAE